MDDELIPYKNRPFVAVILDDYALPKLRYSYLIGLPLDEKRRIEKRFRNQRLLRKRVGLSWGFPNRSQTHEYRIGDDSYETQQQALQAGQQLLLAKYAPSIPDLSEDLLEI